MEICVVSDRSMTQFRKLAAKVVQQHTPTGRFSAIGVKSRSLRLEINVIGRIETLSISQMHEMHRAVDWVYCKFRFVAKACFTVKQS